MWRECSLVLALAFGTANTVFALGSASECSTPPVVIVSGLDRNACQILGSVVVERYLGAKSSSPYANEFDRRDLTVVQGKDPMAVIATVGIDRRLNDFPKNPQFLHSPMKDQVLKVGAERKRFKHRSWSVLTEIFDYGAQGGVPGFPLACAVALHSAPMRTIVVTECFPLEGRPLFINALDSVLL